MGEAAAAVTATASQARICSFLAFVQASIMVPGGRPTPPPEGG